ncbi:MAG: hypothetical protein HQL68_12350, partial [Magnetococcales bacterium]|nr:hypothetical protein [Magnetococcales bacterium]
FPRWLITPQEDVSIYVNELLWRLDRVKEAQAMNVRLDPYRVHVTTLHAKTSKYLATFWELTDVEKVWESHYKAWLVQARLWGQDVDENSDEAHEPKNDYKADKDAADDSEPPKKASKYNSLDELIEGLAILLEKFRVAKVRID